MLKFGEIVELDEEAAFVSWIFPSEIVGETQELMHCEFGNCIPSRGQKVVMATSKRLHSREVALLASSGMFNF